MPWGFEDAPLEIPLWPAGTEGNPGREPAAAGSAPWLERLSDMPSITPFLPDPHIASGAACLVCPGGGYGGLSMEKEGLEPARWLQSLGIATFLVRYRCGGGKHQQPVPLSDLQQAIRVVRSRAGEWGVDGSRVAVLGFSAGGHQTGAASVFFDAARNADSNSPDAQGSRPDLQILIYPVISMDAEITHTDSRRNLLGEDASEEDVAAWTTYRHVSANSPPAFIVHAADDDAVPVENALLYYQALRRSGVPAELHIYENGGHGFGMLRGNAPHDRWPELLKPWLTKHGWVR